MESQVPSGRDAAAGGLSVGHTITLHLVAIAGGITGRAPKAHYRTASGLCARMQAWKV